MTGPLCLVAILLFLSSSANAVLAFPGAEGFGANAKGGRGGAVLCVTTLDDYFPGKESPIPGSLRAAVNRKGPRIVVFRTGGTIALKAPLTITEPCLSIAGQTAPGGGICLTNNVLCIDNTHDIVLRYLRVRPGDAMTREVDAISIGGGTVDVILDHCSASWSVDEVISVSGAGSDCLTVQWCFITESLFHSVHHKGPHGMGSLIRSDGKISYLHNLYAFNNSRNPRPGTYGDPAGLLLDFRNNFIYGWGSRAGYSAADPVRMNYIGNCLMPGPFSKYRREAFAIGGDATHIFAGKNLLIDGDTRIDDSWAMISGVRAGSRVDTPFAVVNTCTESPEDAMEHILAAGGATLPQRDSTDCRIVQAIRDNQGRLIDSQKDVGGYPGYAPGTPVFDSDNDGMPDVWETGHGLDLNDPADASADHDGDGYTHIEEYLNGIPGEVHGPSK